MIMKRFIAFFALVVAFRVILPAPAEASEGIVELESLTSRDYRCFVASIQKQNFSYNVAVSCRNLIYPADEGNLFGYILWAEPEDGSDPFKLGALGLGRAVFSVKKPFDYLFVTTERDNRVRKPSNEVVMEGYISSIEFLDEADRPTATGIPDRDIEDIDDFDDFDEDLEDDEDVQPTTGRQRLVTGIKRALFIVLVLLVVTIATIFILTRRRR
jgi:hypothetical protein